MRRFEKGERLAAADLNLLSAVYEKLKNVRGGPGIDVRNLASGLYIGLNAQISQSLSSSGLAYVSLVQTGGSNAQLIGGSYYPASYRYTLYDANGKELAMSVPLYTARLFAVSIAQTATNGIAGILPQLNLESPGTVPGSGSGGPTPWRLLWCDETFNIGQGCLQSGSGSG